MKHITLFQNNSDYNNYNLDLPNISYSESEKDFHYNPKPNTISFTIDNTTYQADPNMTWVNWVASDTYNPILPNSSSRRFALICFNDCYIGYGNISSKDVVYYSGIKALSTDTIIESANYTMSRM